MVYTPEMTALGSILFGYTQNTRNTS